MDLLAFARGPALVASVTVLVAGSLWRILWIFRHPASKDWSEPRSTATLAGAARTIFTRMLPRRELHSGTRIAALNGYGYHIGLAIIVFGYLPHIAFVKRVLGIAWPALPNWVAYVAAGLAIISLLLALMLRLSDPVLNLLSNFDDYFSWFVTMLPLVTGMVALGALGGHYPPENASDEGTAAAIHLLSFELLLIWLPFGKLSHAFLVFFSRAMTGAQFARRGARA